MAENSKNPDRASNSAANPTSNKTGEASSNAHLPLISVIMPSYNQGRFIRDAIDSVLNQENCRAELIILDGGSNDETVDHLISYGDAFSWTSGPDDGQSAAINEGFERANGDIYCWLNSDDWFTDGALAHVTELFTENPEVQWLFGKGYNTHEDGTIAGFAGVRNFQTWEIIHHRNFINQPSTFWRADLWDKVGRLDVDLHYVMDWELWIRFSAFPRLFTSMPLSNNRVYADNKTQSGKFDRWDEIKRMVELHSPAKEPPVLELYRIEAEIQALREADAPPAQIRPLADAFRDGIVDKRFTGIEPNGVLRPEFSFTVGGTESGSVDLTLEPLSRFVPSRVGADPTRLAWTSSRGGSGVLEIAETGESQIIALPVQAGVGELEHFTVTADSGQMDSPGDGQMVGYLISAV